MCLVGILVLVPSVTDVTGQVESGVFMLEANEFIRDCNQSFTIRFATLFFFFFLVDVF